MYGFIGCMTPTINKKQTQTVLEDYYEYVSVSTLDRLCKVSYLIRLRVYQVIKDARRVTHRQTKITEYFPKRTRVYVYRGRPPVSARLRQTTIDEYYLNKL